MDTLLITLTIITLFCIFCQLAMAMYTQRRLRFASKFYKQALGSRTSGAEFIEKYVRIYRTIPVQVNPNTDEVALAHNNTLAVNRNHVYNKDLYTNTMIAIALSLTNQKFHGLQNNIVIEIFYLLEIIVIITGFITNDWILLIVGMVLAMLLIISAMYRKASFSFVSKDSLDFATDLLNLDKSEQDLTKQLLNIQAARFYLYPFVAVSNLIKFLLP